MMGAGAAAAASRLFQPKPLRGQSANNKVVLGLIGAGGRGTVLGGNFATVENTEFKYVCEVNAERGDALMKKLEEIRGKRPRRVMDMREVFDEPQVQHLGMVKDVVSKWQGPQRLVGQPVQLERTPSTVARSAPRRGEHSEEILMELGLSTADLTRMKSTGVY